MEITKRFKVEMAHRVLDAYTERCNGLHGHSYKIDLTLASDKLDHAGMVIDFKKVKEVFGGVIDAFDHAIVVWSRDYDLLFFVEQLNSRYVIVPYNPTAENMAMHFWIEAKVQGLPVASVTVWETESSCAVFSGPEEAVNFDTEAVIYSVESSGI